MNADVIFMAEAILEGNTDGKVLSIKGVSVGLECSKNVDPRIYYNDDMVLNDVGLDVVSTCLLNGLVTVIRTRGEMYKQDEAKYFREMVEKLEDLWMRQIECVDTVRRDKINI